MSPEFDNTYKRLPERFYSELAPIPVPKPGLVKVNDALARQLGMDPDWLASDAGVQALAGNQLLPGSEPIATVYAGHQFGNWNPRLGDGRAILLGEVVAGGERFDIQLKGSGRTPYSRGGDGRSPLGPVMREYIISEAMFALGIPTTRSLAAVTTGDLVIREVALPGGVLTRVARSHIRVGTFEYLASVGDKEGIELLLEHVLERHYPGIERSDSPALDLLSNVAQRQAKLIAQWQLVGFIHGVMNTDNMLISGETIDYGPCAFMNNYDPDTVYSSIDVYGRYAYGNQPGIGQWNIGALARALLLVLGTEDETIAKVQALVDGFHERFAVAYKTGLAHKLGLAELNEADLDLADDLLTLMYQTGSDYTLTFRKLADLAAPETAELGDFAPLDDAFEPWLDRWHARLAQEASSVAERQTMMRKVNPAFIPRNHQVEAALNAGIAGDFGPFQALVDVLAKPYIWSAAQEAYALPPKPEERVQATFCGT